MTTKSYQVSQDYVGKSSDQSNVKLFHLNPKVLIGSGTPKNSVPTNKHGDGSIMTWSLFWSETFMCLKMKSYLFLSNKHPDEQNNNFTLMKLTF